MPARLDQDRHPLRSLRERKASLILACEVDRAAWPQAFHRSRNPRAQLGRDLLGYLDLVSSLLPGRFGRGLRHAHLLISVGQQLGRWWGPSV